MDPAKRNKIDMTKLTEEEKKLFRLYGRLPAGKDVLSHKLKERKYFDSGDYALSKAGKTSGPVGVQHPSPETIPHANAIAATTHNSLPAKESSLVHETEIDEKAAATNIVVNSETSNIVKPISSTNDDGGDSKDSNNNDDGNDRKSSSSTTTATATTKTATTTTATTKTATLAEPSGSGPEGNINS